MTTTDSPAIAPADVDTALVSRPAVLAPVSLLLAVGGSASYFYMLTIPAVRTTAWPTFAMLALAIALSAAALAQRRRWWTIVSAVGSIVIAAQFVYMFSIEFRLPEAQAGPTVADKAPDFVLPDHQDKKFSLASYLGKGPVLLVFYRGSFCMFCQAELRGLGGIHQTLAKQGGTVLAVSPDPPSACKAMVLECKVDFPVLSDPELKVIDRYGLRHVNGYFGRDVALSASYLIDTDGSIRWKFVGRTFQDLAHPDKIAQEIAKLAAG